MKLHIKVELDAGGEINISGDGLSAEDVNEVFSILSGYTVESTTVSESQDEPLPLGPITDDMKDQFVEGFEEGREANVAPDEQAT